MKRKTISIFLGKKVHGSSSSCEKDHVFNEKLRNIGSFWKKINEKPDLFGKKVLEVGSGLGALSADIALSGAERVIGIDIDQKMIDFSNKIISSTYPELSQKCFFYCCDIKDLKEDDFDYIFSQNTFEHIYDLNEVLREARDRLKQGGKIYTAFSPLYYSPFGDHRRFHRVMEEQNNIKIPQIIFPWMHLVIPERFLNDLVGYFSKKTANKPKEFDIHKGLNKLRLTDYKNVFYNSGLSVEKLDYQDSRKIIRRLQRIPFLEEYFSTAIVCILTKNGG